MTAYVLIWLIFTPQGGVSTGTAYLSTPEACDVAKAAILGAERPWWSTADVSATCTTDIQPSGEF